MFTEKGKPRCVGRLCGKKVEGLPGKVARYEEAQCARECEGGTEFCKICLPRFVNVEERGMEPATWHGRVNGPISKTSLIIGGPRNIALRAKAAEVEAAAAAKEAAAALKAAAKAAATAARTEKAEAAARAKAERAAAIEKRKTEAAEKKAAAAAKKAAAATRRATTAKKTAVAIRKATRKASSSSRSSSSSGSSSSRSSASSTVTSPRRRTARRSTSSSGRTSSSPRRSTSSVSRRSTRKALPLGVGSMAELIAAARGPRGNTPISNISSSAPGSPQIYRPASAGSAPRAPAAMRAATPYSETEQYSSNFESPPTSSNAGAMAY